MYQVDKEYQAPILPPVQPPKGMKFLFGTLSGRIIILNAIFFLLHGLDAGSFLSPSPESLSAWGAKDNALIVEGQIWRLITPIVLHVGLIHFAFNNWALYAIGYQIEHHIGKKWFLGLYLIAGLGGNIASALFSLGLSAGASSSLFGLLGAGFYLEKLLGAKLNKIYGKAHRPSMYTGMLVANIVLGFMIPQIDNAAHIGGLLSGICFTHILLRIRTNSLISRDLAKAKVLTMIGVSILSVATVAASSKDFLTYRVGLAYETSEDPSDQFRYLTKILALSPEDESARLLRLELSLRYGNYSAANVDYLYLRPSPQVDVELDKITHKLILDGKTEAVKVMQRLRKLRK